MNTQVTTQTVQNGNSRNNHINSNNSNKVDFAVEIPKQVANQIYLARRGNPHLDTDSYKSVIYNNGIQGCLDKARMAIFHDKAGTAKYWIAYAWAWANLAGVDITVKIHNLYPRKGTVLAALAVA